MKGEKKMMKRAEEIKTARQLEEVIETIRREGRANGVSFEDREFQIAQIVEAIADIATMAGYGAKQELGREHTQVGRFHRVQYSVCYFPVNPKGDRVGNEVFSNPDWATVHGYFLERSN
jgi:hypothetical protein